LLLLQGQFCFFFLFLLFVVPCFVCTFSQSIYMDK
jgi:hypothetical protein